MPQNKIRTADIVDSQITYAKIQNTASTSILLGRSTAGAGVLEELNAATAKTLLSLNNVENTALSTWTGSSSITTIGTVTTGTWNASTIAVNRGGTGAVTLTGVVIGDGTNALTGIAGTASQLFRRNAANTAYEFFTHDFVNQAGARSAISLTVTGSSGAATYSSATGVLNIPTYTLAGLGGVSGTGTANKVAYWNGTSSITADTTLHWDATNDRLGINTSTPSSTLHVNGIATFSELSSSPTKIAGLSATNELATIVVGSGLSLSGNTLLTTGSSSGIAGTIATGQVAYGTASNTVGGNNNLFWDNAAVELGIGTNAPARTLHVAGTMRLTGSTGTGTTLMARDASGDVSAVTVSTGLSLNNNVLTSTGIVNPMTTLGDTIYGAASGVATRLAGNITTTKQFLSQTGNGSASAAPVWSTVTKSDVGLANVENTALSTWAGSTTITTLGTIATGTWNASTIAVNRGGTGAVTLTGVVIGAGTAALTGIAGTASQLLRRNAANTAYEFFTPDYVNQAGARSAISLTVTGSSGSATYSSATGVLNVPTYTITGLGGVAGTGVTNTLAIWTATSAIGHNVNLNWNPTSNRLGVNTVNPQANLHVDGTMRVTGSTGTASSIMGRNGSGDVSVVGVGTGLSLSSGVLSSTGIVNPMTTLGDTIYGAASGVATRLAGNITTTKQFLSQTGNGSASAAPVWSTVTKSDVGLANVENTALSTWTGSTSITTLGTIATGTWNASTIAVNKGGTGAVTLTGVVIGAGTAALTGIAGTASQLLRRNAANTAYEFFTPDYVNQAGARSAISLTVTGSSGAATYSSGTGILNVPTYTLAGLGGVAGTIAAGQVAYGTASNTVGGNNNLFWDNTNVELGIGTNAPARTLHVAGTMRLTGSTGTGTTLMARDASGDVSAVTVSTGLALANNILTATGGGVTDHGALTGLADDDHTQYVLLAGRAGGQSLYGGTLSGNILNISSTSNATKGEIQLAWDGGDVSIGGGATTSKLMFYSANGLFTTSFRSGTLSTNVDYILPTGQATSGQVLTNDGSGNLSWSTISSGSGITGTVANNQVPFGVGSNSLSGSTRLTWDYANSRLGVNTNSPAQTLHVNGTARIVSSTGTATTLMGRNASGDVAAVSVGSGLVLDDNNIVSATGVTGSGTATTVAFWTGTTRIASNSLFYWDDPNRRLGLNTASPVTTLHVAGKGSFGDSVTSANAERALNIISSDAVMRILRISSDSTTASPALEFMHRTSANGTNTVFFDFYASSNGFAIRDRIATPAPGVQRLAIDSSGRVLFGGGSFTSSAAMQVSSTTGGFLPPKMTTTQRDAIASPVSGLMVYNTTANQMQFYNGTTWVAM